MIYDDVSFPPASQWAEDGQKLVFHFNLRMQEMQKPVKKREFICILYEIGRNKF